MRGRFYGRPGSVSFPHLAYEVRPPACRSKCPLQGTEGRGAQATAQAAAHRFLRAARTDRGRCRRRRGGDPRARTQDGARSSASAAHREAPDPAAAAAARRGARPARDDGARGSARKARRVHRDESGGAQHDRARRQGRERRDRLPGQRSAGPKDRRCKALLRRSARGRNDPRCRALSHRPDRHFRGSGPLGWRWLNSAGLGWTNPYDKRVWKYNVDIAVQAAKLGFDEIQFDYVRFPSDGDITQIRYPGKHAQPMGWTIPMFLKYARSQLKPLGVRLSVDVFGLSATRDLGIAQFPRRISSFVDTTYPMVYPSHYVSGEYNIVDPDSRPGTTVAYSLRDFRRALRGRKAKLIPWLQDFSLGRTC